MNILSEKFNIDDIISFFYFLSSIISYVNGLYYYYYYNYDYVGNYSVLYEFLYEFTFVYYDCLVVF